MKTGSVFGGQVSSPGNNGFRSSKTKGAEMKSYLPLILTSADEAG
jgi:hypothetical protein